ncbi:MAG: VWA domain-containing protein, partial [Gammaproteobacteria bacterium]
VKRLRNSPTGNRVLILLTDGANNAGTIDPLRAADLAAQEGVRIYTIGIGGERVVRGMLGLTFRMGADLDEASLRAIARKTGGRYFRARDPRELEAIYDELDKLEPASRQEKTYRPVAERFRWPLGLALLISLLLALWLGGIGRRRHA